MFPYPHAYSPTPEAQSAARDLLARVHLYMEWHPDSELHRRGKMFGVLIAANGDAGGESVTLQAFSGMLDGTYFHEGFVPPIYAIRPEDVVGDNRADSQKKQQWIFRQFRLLNALGEQKDVLECFADEPTFGGYPPAGTGECCAPKLLQAAYLQHLQPIAMAEIWIGASPKDEVRTEGQYYPACISKCRPLLRHMLAGIQVAENPLIALGKICASHTRVIYKDEYLLVVDKPSGLLSVPGRDGQFSLTDYLKTCFPECEYLMPAHRLDMDTSGLLIVAKTEEVLTALQRQFFCHEVYKEYWAELQSDLLPSDSGTISLPLAANPLDRPRQQVSFEFGKRAVTHYERMDANAVSNPSLGVVSSAPRNGVLVRLRPETGRTHQLRVHCAHPDGLNNPISGDRLYGNVSNTGKSNTNNQLRLHASVLEFLHPITGQRLRFQSNPRWLK